MRFVTNATDLASEDYYDYIIVGGGTAGCPLAATLSQSFRVLLLERGGFPYTRPNVMTHDGFLTTHRRQQLRLSRSVLRLRGRSAQRERPCSRREQRDQRWVLQQS
uniref:Glucose-methanol-choline oxidoreductase N-terminal domain-containing protein n=1 Tax=Brassica campestris TaxID=3711 RepID=M4EX99_BRACM